MFGIIEPIELNYAHREHLKAMIKDLCPEYTHSSIGGLFISLSKTPMCRADIIWSRMHWLEFLLRVALIEIYQRGIYSDNWKVYDDNWMAGLTKEIINAIQSPENKHPVVVIYDEFLKVANHSKHRD